MKQYFLDLKLGLFTGTYFVISFTDVDAIMKVLAFIAATGYTLRRWYLLEKKNKDETE